MTKPFIHIDLLRMFSADGLVYRSFGHLIASRMGALLLVPHQMVVCDIEGTLIGCPVPHEEVYAVLEYPAGERVSKVIAEQIHYLALLDIDPADCDIDMISPMVHGRETTLRLVHPSGVRFAMVMR